MNGKTVKVLRKYARIKNYREEGMKLLWNSLDRVKRGKAKRFMVHVINQTARAAANVPAQA